MTEKEIKEITRENERQVFIQTKECIVRISSPHKSDSIKKMVNEADRLTEKYSKQQKDNMVW